MHEYAGDTVCSPACDNDMPRNTAMYQTDATKDVHMFTLCHANRGWFQK